MAVLNMAADLEKQKLEHTPTKSEFAEQRPNSQQVNQFQQNQNLIDRLYSWSIRYAFLLPQYSYFIAFLSYPAN